MKNTILTLILASMLGAGIARAQQITIDDFSALTNLGTYEGNGWEGKTSVNGGVFTVGAGADNNGTFFFVPPMAAVPIDATAPNFSTVSVTARIDAGNFASGFQVIFFDGNGDGALLGVFSASNFTNSFSTYSVVLQAHPNAGNAADIQYYGLSGTISGDAFRMSFDQIVLGTAVPEPATYALFAGVIGLSLVVWRRRNARV